VECGPKWAPGRAPCRAVGRAVAVRCAVRKRDERRVGGAAVHLAAGRAMVRVGFASSGGEHKSREASVPRAAVAAFRCISIFGGAEAPEQLLGYLVRRKTVSVQAGSVYRSVNASAGRVVWFKGCGASGEPQRRGGPGGWRRVVSAVLVVRAYSLAMSKTGSSRSPKPGDRGWGKNCTSNGVRCQEAGCVEFSQEQV
jgi:hypothetical protein